MSFLFILSTLGIVGCESDPNSSVDLPPGNTIEVVVHYDGTQEGTAIAGVFTECPPEAGPMAFAVDESPEFPQTLTIFNVLAGEHFINVILDIGHDNPMMPGDEDLQSCGDHSVIISDEEGATIDVVLHDQ